MLDYIELRGMRILDFFRQMDKSGKLLLRKKDFIDGLRKAGIPLRMSQVDNIFDILDRNNDGLAHYREFVKLLQQQTYNEFATTRSNFQQKYLDRS